MILIWKWHEIQFIDLDIDAYRCAETVDSHCIRTIHIVSGLFTLYADYSHCIRTLYIFLSLLEEIMWLESKQRNVWALELFWNLDL